MLKHANLDAADVKGSGGNGRITKEDVQRHLAMAKDQARQAEGSNTNVTASSRIQPVQVIGDRKLALNAVERKMFQVMTQSLSIPHFAFSHSIDATSLSTLRQTFNLEAAARGDATKLTLLPFIVKAVSLAFLEHPRLNAHLDFSAAADTSEPQVTLKGSHDFGLAIDSPQGLVVPVIRDVQNHSVVSLVREIKRLGELARTGRLTPEDFKGASFTISNIGSIGGYVVSPVIVSPMVAILAVGKTKLVPVVRKAEQGHEAVVSQEQVVLSWSADHRVLDGATVARAAMHVERLLGEVHKWALDLR
jgi:2-oxoisovalerate dehydrogenase E2 component (dihydrolipoyl transacylase)